MVRHHTAAALDFASKSVRSLPGSPAPPRTRWKITASEVENY